LPDTLVIEEVADLMDHGQLGMAAEAAKPKTQSLSCSVTPLVGASFGGGASTDDW
jgi:hypothetical protein